MTRGVVHYKTRQQIQCERIERQIQELRDIQDTLIPGYNYAPAPEPEAKPKSHWDLLIIPALMFIALVTSSIKAIEFVVASGLMALFVAFITFIFADISFDIGLDTISNFASKIFYLACKFIKFGLYGFIALCLTAFIKALFH